MARNADSPRAELLSTVSLPFAPNHPNPHLLSWSDDLQAAFITKQELHILTPSCGLAVDHRNVQLTGVPRGWVVPQDQLQDPARLDWFRTDVSAEAEVFWEHYTNDIGDTLVSAQCPYWKAASWSPRGLSSGGTCLLAALSSNAEVFIYGPTHIPHRSQWNKTFDLTLALHNVLMPELEPDRQTNTEYRRHLSYLVHQWQVTSMHWSAAPRLATSDGSKRSLLATAHRSGHVVFWCTLDTGELQPVARVRPAKSWITDIQWHDWSVSSNGKAHAKLALCTSDAQLIVMQITQILSQPLSDLDVPFKEQLQQSDVKLPSCISSLILHTSHPFSSPITALKWYDSDHLLFTRLQSVGNVSGLDDLDECRTQEFDLQPVGDWQGVNPWSPCSGIAVDQTSKQALIGLYDGSLHVLDMSPDRPSPRLLYGPEEASTRLTQGKRRLDVENERHLQPGSISKAVMMKTFAVAALPSGELSWLSQMARPDLLVYQSEGSQATSLVLSNLKLGAPATSQLEVLKTSLSDRTCLLRRAPAATTFSSIIDLRRKTLSLGDADLQELWGNLVAAGSPDPSTGAASDFVGALLHLFQSSDELQERMLATYTAYHMSLLAPGRTALQAWHSHLTLKLAQTLLSGLAQVFFAFNGKVEDLNLLQAINAALDSANPEVFDGSFEPVDLAQTCAACQAPVLFDHLRFATCQHGHRWDRCSLTLQPIFSLASRTCVGCGRKYSKRPVDEEPRRQKEKANQKSTDMDVDEHEDQSERQMGAEPWSLQDVAKLIKVCIWCGSHTMSLR